MNCYCKIIYIKKTESRDDSRDLYQRVMPCNLVPFLSLTCANNIFNMPDLVDTYH